MDKATLFSLAAKIYRAVNHELRKKIMDFISDKERPVTDIYVGLRIEQSVCSQHLAILRQAGVVKTRREKKQIFYSVDNDRVQQLIKVSDHLLNASKTSSLNS